MSIKVKFTCPRDCGDYQIVDYENLDELLGQLSESGWPICFECGEDTTHEIMSSGETTEINVQELIDELNTVKDKRQIVAGCVRGIEVCESLIVGVSSEEPDDDTVGVCWLKFRDDSCIHEL